MPKQTKNTWIGTNGQSWETGAHWSLGHKPTSSEYAYFSDGANIPTGPVGGSESCGFELASAMQGNIDFSNLALVGRCVVTEDGGSNAILVDTATNLYELSLIDVSLAVSGATTGPTLPAATDVKSGVDRGDGTLGTYTGTGAGGGIGL